MYIFLNYKVFLSLKYFCPCFAKIKTILANSADPDEMLHYAAFHLGLHCLPKYPFRFPVSLGSSRIIFSSFLFFHFLVKNDVVSF